MALAHGRIIQGALEQITPNSLTGGCNEPKVQIDASPPPIPIAGDPGPAGPAIRRLFFQRDGRPTDVALLWIDAMQSCQHFSRLLQDDGFGECIEGFAGATFGLAFARHGSRRSLFDT